MSIFTEEERSILDAIYDILREENEEGIKSYQERVKKIKEKTNLRNFDEVYKGFNRSFLKYPLNSPPSEEKEKVLYIASYLINIIGKK